ncbi:MAG: YggT family protein [Ignavibacteriales bacterium]
MTMAVLGNLIMALAQVLHLLLNVYMLLIIVRAIISWVSPDPYNPIVNFLYRATDPVLRYVQRIIPPLGGIDLSPILVLIVIVFLDQFLIGSLREFGFRLKTGTL